MAKALKTPPQFAELKCGQWPKGADFLAHRCCRNQESADRQASIKKNKLKYVNQARTLAGKPRPETFSSLKIIFPGPHFQFVF